MKKQYRILIHILLVVGFIAGGIAGCRVLRAARPPLGRQAVAPSYPLARVISARMETIAVPIQGFGTVRPQQEIKLIPQVAGKITLISPQLVDGGVFKKGDVLAEIDPADYAIAVTLADARVEDAYSRFVLKEQETQVAISDWEQLHPGSPVPPLVAREHQLKASQANLEASRAELEKARLSLSRTRLAAPFNGRVSQKSVDIDQYVSPGQSLAVLYSIDAVEIVIPMESRHLLWFDVPGFTTAGTKGSEVAVYSEIGQIEQVWKGKVVRTEGVVNDKTRMINVVVRVMNPYDRYPPLAPGLFVRAEIKGRAVEKGIIIPRSSLQGKNSVWVVDDNEKLALKPVEIAVATYEGLVVSNGLSDGEKVVIAAVKDATAGMKVKSVPAEGGAEQ